MGKPKFLINRGYLRFPWNTLHLCKSGIIIKTSSRGHRNKSNKNHYPASDDAEMIADDR